MATTGSGSASLTVGIVGGSIAGCTAAIMLARIGCDVTVFERSHGELQGRGAGIGSYARVIDELYEQGLVDDDFPVTSSASMHYLRRTDAENRLGRHAWQQRHDFTMMHWGDLYRQLRKRVPNTAYRPGCDITDVRQPNESKAALTLSTGETATFDVVVFADGYRSFGRQQLFPDTELRYAGYVAWRGLVGEDAVNDPDPLEQAMVRIGYSGGHGIIYLVPGLDGSTVRRQRLINWAIYVPVTEHELPAMLTDSDGRVHGGSLPPRAMPIERENRLKESFRTHFPTYWSGIIDRTPNTFVQAIYDTTVPAYRSGRICLAGDAGALAPPHTGSGVFKAMNNGLGLASALETADSIDAGLATWNESQTAGGNRMVIYGRQAEEALVTAIPNWAEMSEPEMEEWWTSVGAEAARAFGRARAS
jgi:2-polyprenyl-6-methoxyphenol hydroxylase-like FAD-dependent oxidoreductase